jgi:Chaperone of endosialidase
MHTFGLVRVLTVRRNVSSWRTELKGRLYVENDIQTSGDFQGRLNGCQAASLLGRELGPQKIRAVVCLADAIHLHKNQSSSDPRFALFHDFVNSPSQPKKDGLVINHQSSYKDGVRIEGNVQVTGALTQASSIALKENVAELSGQEAMAALQDLNAVKYNYKADDRKEQRIGFIAEEVPDLVANSERDRLSPMDLIAVLTKAVQEQQRTITELASEMNTLKQQNGGK